ncbi:MAG: glycerate kinase, partial [Ottowia sp.]|nr:glycerate kinase [Ottowia sp.]
TIMKRAADRPIGYVGSAVMLNAKLKPRMALLHVVGLTRALGERLSPEGTEPEVYRWRDPGDSHVTAEFEGGRLARWRLERPAEPAGPAGGEA